MAVTYFSDLNRKGSFYKNAYNILCKVRSNYGLQTNLKKKRFGEVNVEGNISK